MALRRFPIVVPSRAYPGAATDSDWYMRSIRERFRLVVFNKEGTLTRFNAHWLPWANQQAQRLLPLIGFDSTKLIYRSLTDIYKDAKAEEALGRKVPAPQFDELRQSILSKIRNRLNTVEQSKPVQLNLSELSQAIEPPTLPLSEVRTTRLLPPSSDLKRLFCALKSRCIRVAMITSDSRANTMSDLRHLNALSYFDELQCGDDIQVPGKPHPAALLQLCKTMEVEPSEMVVVGDTVRDLQMAQHAYAGMRIGVLSGISSASDLAPYSDYLLPHIGYMLPLVVNQRMSPIFLDA